ncbi:MAG TPA: VOC family protein [Microbacterium sp.]|nr:VOC family protein [Microbacterium sp.]
MTNMTIHTTALPLVDAEASLVFWRDAIGFEVRSEVGQGDMRWITVGPEGKPDTCILLQPPFADPGLSGTERETISDLMAKGSFGWILLASDDVDADFARIQAHPLAEVIQEPADQPYGVRDCAFRDPAGNTVRLRQV